MGILIGAPHCGNFNEVEHNSVLCFLVKWMFYKHLLEGHFNFYEVREVWTIHVSGRNFLGIIQANHETKVALLKMFGHVLSP